MLLISVFICKQEDYLLNNINKKNRLCDDKIDSAYCELRKSNVDTIFMYKEINYMAGVSGVVIWQKQGLIKGISFITDNTNGIMTSHRLTSQDDLLMTVIKEYFQANRDIKNLSASKLETMHDFEVRIKSYLNGSEKKFEFLNSQINNNDEFLAKISKACKNLIYE